MKVLVEGLRACDEVWKKKIETELLQRFGE